MKRQEDLLNLKWRDFKENATSAFRALREEQEFADVTLVCEDGQHVEAHKAILASSSPLFLNLLKDNQNPHPFIFMTDLKYETVLAMVDFLYNGETNVDEEEVKLFLAAAEELKVKGLANLDAQFKSQKNSNKKKHKITYFKDELDEILFDFDEKTNVNTEKDISKPTQKKKHTKKNFHCDMCGKEYKLSGGLHVHKKSCLDQKPTKCDLCEKVFKGEFRMQIHKKRSHKDLHPCPECSTQVKNLSKHMLRVHINEKRFPCSQCDKGFIEGDKLRDHIRSVHDKEKPYECRYDCGVRVSSPAYRRKHEKQKHGQAWEGVEREGGLLGTANTFL